jgi:hypothetical protein
VSEPSLPDFDALPAEQGRRLIGTLGEGPRLLPGRHLPVPWRRVLGIL